MGNRRWPRLRSFGCAGIVSVRRERDHSAMVPRDGFAPPTRGFSAVGLRTRLLDIAPLRTEAIQALDRIGRATDVTRYAILRQPPAPICSFFVLDNRRSRKYVAEFQASGAALVNGDEAGELEWSRSLLLARWVTTKTTTQTISRRPVPLWPHLVIWTRSELSNPPDSMTASTMQYAPTKRTAVSNLMAYCYPTGRPRDRSTMR